MTKTQQQCNQLSEPSRSGTSLTAFGPRPSARCSDAPLVYGHRFAGASLPWTAFRHALAFVSVSIGLAADFSYSEARPTEAEALTRCGDGDMFCSPSVA